MNNTAQEGNFVIDAASDCLSSLHSSSASLQPLEEATTCPIHLGSLREPKLLACSHAFCLACLERWAKRQANWKANCEVACPLCRTIVTLPERGVAGLPAAATQNCVLEYIASRRRRRRRRRRRQCRLRAMERREEKDEEEEEEDEDEVEEKDEDRDEDDGWSTATDDDDSVDPPRLTLARRSMQRHSVYKVKELDVALKGVQVVDLGLLGDEREQQELALLDGKSGAVMVYKKRLGRFRRLPIALHGRRLACKHLQVSRNEIFVTGQLMPPEGDDSLLSAVVRLDPDGRILRHCSRRGVEFAGLSVHATAGRLALALPTESKVEFLNAGQLSWQARWFTFDSLRPRCVAWSTEPGVLWVSCPEEGQLLLVQEGTGAYRRLTTTAVCQCPPTQIVATSDGRVLFGNGERVFWIVRRGEFVLLQSLRCGGGDCRVAAMAALPAGRILAVGAKRVFVLKPARQLHRRRHSKCRIM